MTNQRPLFEGMLPDIDIHTQEGTEIAIITEGGGHEHLTRLASAAVRLGDAHMRDHLIQFLDLDHVLRFNCGEVHDTTEKWDAWVERGRRAIWC